MKTQHSGICHLGIAGIALVAGVAMLIPAGAGATARAVTVKVTAGKPTEFGFQLLPKTVKHGAVIFKVTNRGTIQHDFKICASPKGGKANACTGKKTKLLNPGASTTLTYTFKKKGTYEYLCTVPSHAAAGMKGDLKVT
jgi:uncharacterized cupredoxin-like copper-binding protein